MSQPAAGESRQKAQVVKPMATKRASSSRKASPGRCRPKKIQDHRAFKANWQKNKARGQRAPAKPWRRQTNQAATAMQI